MILYIREKSTAIPSSIKWKSRELIPNGRLAVKFGIFGQFEVSDSKASTIEQKIDKILIKIESEFFKWKEIRERHEAEKEREEVIRKINEQIKKAKEDELLKFKAFYNAAHRWKKYTILKEYFEFLQSNKLEDKERLDWISKKLDWYNPLLEREDELLSEVDKETLNFKEVRRGI